MVAKAESVVIKRCCDFLPSLASLGDGLLCSVGSQRDEAKRQAFSLAQDLNLGTMPGRPMIMPSFWSTFIDLYPVGKTTLPIIDLGDLEQKYGVLGKRCDLHPSLASLGDGLLCSVGSQRDEAKKQASALPRT